MKKRGWLIAAVLVILALTVTAYRKTGKVAMRMDSAPGRDVALFQKARLQPDEELMTIAASPQPQRKIIRNAEVGLVVKHYEPFFTALEKEASQMGAYISQIQVNRSSGNVTSANIVLRIPPQKLLISVSWLREQGMITSEKVTAEDVSEHYYDLQARFSNARNFEQRLLEMLKTRTGNLTDVVQVEEKLNQVREQIEQMEGRLRYLDNLVGLATLSLNVSVQETYVPPHTPGFSERAGLMWHNSILSVKEFGEGVLLFAIGATPWLLPTGGFVLFVLFLLKAARFLRRSLKVRNVSA